MPTRVPRSQSQGSVFNCECQAILRALERMAILNFSSGFCRHCNLLMDENLVLCVLACYIRIARNAPIFGLRCIADLAWP
jgi:hypothetical protein